MYTAQPLSGSNMFEQGAGEINVEGAMRLAKLVRSDLTTFTALGAPLLVTSAPAEETTLSSEIFPWARGIIMNHSYTSGSDLVTKYQVIYGRGFILGDGVAETPSSQAVNATRMTSSVLLGMNIVTSDGTFLGGGSFFMALSLLLSDGIMLRDGIVIGDGVM